MSQLNELRAEVENLTERMQNLRADFMAYRLLLVSTFSRLPEQEREALFGTFHRLVEGQISAALARPQTPDDSIHALQAAADRVETMLRHAAAALPAR